MSRRTFSATADLPLFMEPEIRAAREQQRRPSPPVVTPPTDGLAARFDRFHKKNPHVFAALLDRAKVRLFLGDRRISVAALTEDLRRDGTIDTRGDPFKFNNSYRPFYARLLIAECPALADVIETRPLKISKAKPS